MTSPRRPPHHGHSQKWMVNSEQTDNLENIAEQLIKIGHALKENGELTINDVNIVPQQQPLFTVRYERLPRGELKLKLEIEWEDGAEATVQNNKLVIE